MKLVTLKHKDDIAIISLTGGVTNPIDLETLRGLNDSLDRVVEGQRSTGGILLTSSSSKFFSIGFDIPSLLQLDRCGIAIFYDAFNKLLLKLSGMPIPTLAAIPGHCIAAGCIIAACCDHRLMANGKGKIGVTAVKLGVHLPFLADKVLRNVLKPDHADELLAKGDLFDIHWAADAGYIDGIKDPQYLRKGSIEFLQNMTRGPTEPMLKRRLTWMGSLLSEYLRVKEQDDSRFIDTWFSRGVQDNLREAMKKY